VSFGPTPLTESTYDLYWIAVDKSKHIQAAVSQYTKHPARTLGGK